LSQGLDQVPLEDELFKPAPLSPAYTAGRFLRLANDLY
jgi:hypothetical protein